MTVVQFPTRLENYAAAAARQFVCNGASLATGALRGVTVVSAFGEFDATNMHHLADCAERNLLDTRSLIVDLTEVRFFAARGIQALFDIDAACDRVGAQWALVAGRIVPRLLRICVTGIMLPVAPSLDDAMQMLQFRVDFG